MHFLTRLADILMFEVFISSTS